MHESPTSGPTRRRVLRAVVGSGVAAPIGMLATPASPAFADPAAFPGLELPAASKDLTPFRLRVPESALADLRRRLATARLPERETVDDGTQGARLARVRRLARHWLTTYDWRRVEARLNGYEQFRTEVDGLGIHFLHVRSRHRNALPLLLTHGWPGSVVEFLDVIEPLTDPTAFGGTSDDAFHLVVPSLPGYGFSDKPTSSGWNTGRIAEAWKVLMRRLGYDRYVAQGGDWGAVVTSALAKSPPPELAGVHLNMFAEFEPPLVGEPTPEEQEALRKLEAFTTDGFGYFAEQSTRPQTVGYGLADSPVGQAAWIYEKFTEWTDSDGVPENVLGYDRMLDDIMLYWLPNTAASSARIYWENARETPNPGDYRVPVGFTRFPGEIVPIPRVWAERVYKDRLVYFNKAERGGHFAAFEQPAIFTRELRAFARLLR